MHSIPTEFLLTKIVATIGPASDAPETIRQLIAEGVRVFRVNFSHGTLAEHERSLNEIRRASDETGVPVAVMGDLSGPKIRIGQVVNGGIKLEVGQQVEFQNPPVITAQADKPLFSTTYPRLAEEVQPGQPVLLDDGNIRLVAIGKREEGKDQKLVCQVVDGGIITSNKGVNLPQTELSAPSLNEKDHRCVEFAVKKRLDYLALSFVRSGQDVRLLKDRLRELGARPVESAHRHGPELEIGRIAGDIRHLIPVISKIEKPQAIDDLDNILEETDAVMVARGDLGVEMELADVAVLQKRIIGLCHDYAIPVIVATQMLQSMIESPTPTRAEVSDVANAIFDGADAVMLSGETAIGKWPVEAVRMMNRIAHSTNDYLREQAVEPSAPRRLRELKRRAPALAHGVQTIVRDLDAKLIVVWSQLGGAAVYLSQHRMPRPILACSPSPEILRRWSLLYGLRPVRMEQPATAREFYRQTDRLLLEKQWAHQGDPVVFVLGEPMDRIGVTNQLCVHYVGEG